MAKAPHILVVEARFYDEIADGLLAGAKAVLSKAGATFDVITVPGILELPPAALFALTAKRRGKKRYAGFVALGCAVKGETDHYEHVCNQAMSGVMRVGLDLRLASGNGILTCPTWELAQDRADPKRGNAGGRAASACLRLLELKTALGR